MIGSNFLHDNDLFERLRRKILIFGGQEQSILLDSHQ